MVLKLNQGMQFSTPSLLTKLGIPPQKKNSLWFIGPVGLEIRQDPWIGESGKTRDPKGSDFFDP